MPSETECTWSHILQINCKGSVKSRHAEILAFLFCLGLGAFTRGSERASAKSRNCEIQSSPPSVSYFSKYILDSVELLRN